MVRLCCYPGCFNQMKLSSVRPDQLSFHRLPVHDPYRLRLWLLALRLDLNSPLETLRALRVCGEHFSRDDFKQQPSGRLYLKATAVPNTSLPEGNQSRTSPQPDVTLTQKSSESSGHLLTQYGALQLVLTSPQGKERRELPSASGTYHALPPTWSFQAAPGDPSHHPGAEDIVTLGDESSFAPPLQSTPVKVKSREETYLTEHPHRQQLLLKSPETQGERTHPSTSGAYYALAPKWSAQTGLQVPSPLQSMEHSFEHDISMLSIDVHPDTKDPSYVVSSTTTSTPSSEDNGEMATWQERKWVVNQSRLMQLFENCHKCGGRILEPHVSSAGSQVRITWDCLNGHSGVWSSCPDVRGLPENNLLAAASTLFTGATYTTIADWAELLNLQLPKKTIFYSIQSSYLIPAIDIKYTDQHKAIMERLLQMQTGVHVSGDGRSDSPGYSAKYNTYSFMEDTSKEIVHFELVQVTEASSSVAMEAVGFRRGLDYLQEQGVEVEVVTTDRSPSIRKIMREEHPEIHHEFDIWHVVKGLMKKLLAVSNQKDNRDLQPWIKSICNHLWYACATCGGDPDILTKKWKTLLHHICGVHRWEEDGEEKTCQHGDLSPEEQRRKRWLQKDSPAFKALYSVALDKRLMQDLRQMALFKHTGKLEVFHAALLKYTEKKLHFHYSSMRARTQLAIMDHNENAQREQATTASGDPRFNVVFPKQTKEWIAKKIYVPTTQTFRQKLVVEVLQRRLDPTIKYKDPTSRVSDPPLPPNIATKPKTSKEEVIEKHQTRFNK